MDRIVAVLVSSLSRYWVAWLPSLCCSQCETLGWSALCTNIDDLTRRVMELLLLL